MIEQPRLLDTVALLSDHPVKRLRQGQVGTVVERLDDQHVEIEFSDDRGRTYATAALPIAKLMVLHHEPAS